MTYARDWFRSQTAWTLISKGANPDPFQTYSWDYVRREVEIALNEFIVDEYAQGIGGWHESDIDFSLLEDELAPTAC